MNQVNHRDVSKRHDREMERNNLHLTQGVSVGSNLSNLSNDASGEVFKLYCKLSLLRHTSMIGFNFKCEDDVISEADLSVLKSFTCCGSLRPAKSFMDPVSNNERVL